MPAPKAFLRQMAQFGLDPLKAYTKGDVGNDGHIRKRVARPDVIVAKVEEPKPTSKKEAPKPIEVEKPASVVPPAPKSDKSVKAAPAKPAAEVKKVEAPTAPQATGEKASDESTVDPKESTDSATATDAGAASTVKPA